MKTSKTVQQANKQQNSLIKTQNKQLVDDLILKRSQAFRFVCCGEKFKRGDKLPIAVTLTPGYDSLHGLYHKATASSFLCYLHISWYKNILPLGILMLYLELTVNCTLMIYHILQTSMDAALS